MPASSQRLAVGFASPRSRFHAVRTVTEVPLFLPLFAACVLCGFRDSMSMPYTTLFAVERAHMGPLALGGYLTVRAGGAIVMSMLMAAWFDRRPSLRPLLLALVAGSLGYALQTATTDFGCLCLIAAVPLGLGASAFPLLFALAKVQAAGSDPVAATRSITMLRAAFSMAWGVGPAIGAVVVGESNYNALFWVSAVFSGVAFLPMLLQPLSSRPHVAARSEAARVGLAVTLAAGSLTLFSLAIGMGMVALPIAITVDLAGAKGDVGLAQSVCALLEVPVMMAIAARPTWLAGFKGMALGFVAMALYFALAALAPSVGALLWIQFLRAIGIGFVSCVGIGYLQDLMPGRVGAASALYANTGQIGNLLAGLAAGGFAQAFGYHALFWPCAAASVGGLACLAAGRRTAARLTSGAATPLEAPSLT